MESSIICPYCHKSDINRDLSKGSIFCINCSFVLDESNIENTALQFEDDKITGTRMSKSQLNTSFLKNKHGNLIGDSKESRNIKAFHEINNIAEKLCKCLFEYCKNKINKTI